ncbi:MAG: hypothetical protein HY677_02545 [Chloroflexi bacterium]|nr:hypothetical protein [Chloroflexota bacterium]
MRSRNRELQLALGLLCLIALFLFGIGVYHLTHRGHPSGIMELSLTAILFLAMYLIMKGT